MPLDEVTQHYLELTDRLDRTPVPVPDTPPALAGSMLCSVTYSLLLHNETLPVLVQFWAAAAHLPASTSSSPAWMRQAYQSWWAGKGHVFAYVLYVVLATFSIFLILTFQVIGIFAIYVTIGMYFGTTLTVVLASLGVKNCNWVAALVVIYVLLMPMFTLVPWVVFRRAEENAQRLRVAQLRSSM